jgi:hypothetical protein
VLILSQDEDQVPAMMLSGGGGIEFYTQFVTITAANKRCIHSFEPSFIAVLLKGVAST